MTTLEKLASEDASQQDAGLDAALHYDPGVRARLVETLLERVAGNYGSPCAYPILLVAAGDAHRGERAIRSFMRWTLEQAIERAISLDADPGACVLSDVELGDVVDTLTKVERGTPPDPETLQRLWGAMCRFEYARTSYSWAWFHLLKATYYSVAPTISSLRQRVREIMMVAADSISYATGTGAYDALYPEELRRRAADLTPPSNVGA